jgi:hypothetical protein
VGAGFEGPDDIGDGGRKGPAHDPSSRGERKSNSAMRLTLQAGPDCGSKLQPSRNLRNGGSIEHTSIHFGRCKTAFEDFFRGVFA